MDKPYRRTGEAVVRAVPAGEMYHLDFPAPLRVRTDRV